MSDSKISDPKINEPNYNPWEHLHGGSWFWDPAQAVERLLKYYDEAITELTILFSKLSTNESKPNFDQLPTYPFVGIVIDKKSICLDPVFAFGSISVPGNYGTTITDPKLFYNYYLEQITMLIERHRVPVYVAKSRVPIPLPFALNTLKHSLEVDDMRKLSNHFVMPDLTRINDWVANASNRYLNELPDKPLSLFSAERTDFSLHRLHHYTGTEPKHFQPFVLLTNYQRYVDEFNEFAIEEIKNNPNAIELIGPGDVTIFSKNSTIQQVKKLPQMPAYHLVYNDKQPGITLVNIGVGPSNAKTITDHIAVLRPHCWIMLGHCAGLRASQRLGDYVLADCYVRKDHVLDDDLPIWVPIPPIAEIQQALQKSISNFEQRNRHFHGPEELQHEIDSRVRTGTVYTTDNRNWELQSQELYEQFKQSRAIAVDMESATIAANGFRFRVPYGTLLCVSDKPIHGVIKLQSMAKDFYQTRIQQHLHVGIEAINIIAADNTDRLHSRKLRGFEECPFR